MGALCAIGLVLAATLVAVGPAEAGYDHERNGFFLGFGLGLGGDNEQYKIGKDDSGGGFSGNFRIGGALNRTVALGLETAAFSRRAKTEAGIDVTRSVSMATFGVTWFPVQDGLYLRGGLGFASASLEVELPAGGSVSGDEGGLGILGAVGYEFRLTKKFALAPQFQYAFAGIDGEVIESIGFWSLTAQFTWWW